ncbi:porin family protein [Limnohabitans sp. G3-2]|uniref:porin family protein n=1 Tax=Limnohabitans sp. G3-2 TaxID=1100711 RepID=UPI000C1EE316|nr:porin family protein [Limnohabitans sp. G3-2]PIT77015.1 hypothetical protein B9Z31_03415 [Limnohabitans sp. G3-2]
MKKFAITAAIALASVAAQAQIYGEVGYTTTRAKITGDGEVGKASPSALRGFLGYELNPNLAVEGMAAFGMSDATVKVDGVATEAKLEIDNAVGLYLKPKVKLNDDVEMFGRVGFARVKGTLSVPGLGSETYRDSGFSYGAGLSYAINPSTSLNADYMHYFSKDGIKVNGFTVGVGFKF